MESLRSQLVCTNDCGMRTANASKRWRLVSSLMVGLGILVNVGCFGTTKQTITPNTPTAQKPYIPKAGQPAKIVTMWDNQVVHAPDTYKGGSTFPGFKGRMLIFDPKIGVPILSDGWVLIDLYDHSGGPNAEPKHVHSMRVDPATLKQWVTTDRIGKGFDLFLDWPEYNESVTRVAITVAFVPTDGTPNFEPKPESFRLLHQTPSFTIDHRTTLEMKARGIRVSKPADLPLLEIPEKDQPKEPAGLLPKPTPIPILPE